MTTHCDEMLVAFGPVHEILIHTRRSTDGWSCTLRHRHLAGLFTDCPNDHYDRLTADELIDVLEASVALLTAYEMRL